MSTSRSVDHLTFTYYTGQNGSVPNGPNCHNCMNELFRENSLIDVQFAYVSTSRGFVALNIRSLIFLNGVETPFTVPGFTEDILVTCCIMCAKKAPVLQKTEAQSNVEVESITRKKKLASDCSTNLDTESFDEKENSNEAAIPSYVLHDCKPIMPTINGDSSRLSSTDTESLNHLPMLNSPVGNHGSITSINRNNDEVVSNCGNESVTTVAVESHTESMNFPFLRAKKRSDTPDAMTEEEILTKVAPLRKILKSHILYVDSEFFASKKVFYCEYCDRLFRSAIGVAMVDHIFSNSHMSTVYEKGLVFCCADFKGLVKICRKLHKRVVTKRENLKTRKSRPVSSRDVDVRFPRGMRSDERVEPMQNFIIELDDFSNNLHLSTLDVDFPFTRGRLSDQVTDPMHDFAELEEFSRNLSDDSLTSVVKYSFPCKESIHCYYCNVVFEPPHGAMFMRHLISSSHYSKVIGSDRVFSVSGDLNRLKRMCRGATIIRKSDRS